MSKKKDLIRSLKTKVIPCEEAVKLIETMSTPELLRRIESPCEFPDRNKMAKRVFIKEAERRVQQARSIASKKRKYPSYARRPRQSF